MSDTTAPTADASVHDLISKQCEELDAQRAQILDLSERLQLYERRLDALAAYFREAAYVL